MFDEENLISLAIFLSFRIIVTMGDFVDLLRSAIQGSF